MNFSELGSIIKNRRRQLKITQQDLADFSEVNINTIVSIERGKGNPKFLTVNNICKVLGLEITIK